jgi:peptidoglycan hydrolase-like protein with peptidoglycan-binding domain
MERILRGGLLATLALLLAAAGGCQGGQSAEDRAREAAEEISRSQPNVEATALAQTVDESTVKTAQEHLKLLHEYQGEIDGALDSVTVNAIQAFQRSAGLRDDGLLNERTRERLARAAAGAGSG